MRGIFFALFLVLVVVQVSAKPTLVGLLTLQQQLDLVNKELATVLLPNALPGIILRQRQATLMREIAAQTTTPAASPT